MQETKHISQRCSFENCKFEAEYWIEDGRNTAYLCIEHVPTDNNGNMLDEVAGYSCDDKCKVCNELLTTADIERIEEEEEQNKLDTWTITAQCTVFPPTDTSKEDVMQTVEAMLQDMTDGSDIASISVTDATRDEL